MGQRLLSSWDHKLERLLRFVLRKPLEGRESLRLGTGTWYDLHEQKLWVWQFDIGELVNQLELRGFKLTHRVVGELSEIQRRVQGPLRAALLRLNNLWFRLKLPPGPAVTNLLVFVKHKAVAQC
jgi:hypothetical protein